MPAVDGLALQASTVRTREMQCPAVITETRAQTAALSSALIAQPAPADIPRPHRAAASPRSRSHAAACSSPGAGADVRPAPPAPRRVRVGRLDQRMYAPAQVIVLEPDHPNCTRLLVFAVHGEDGSESETTFGGLRSALRSSSSRPAKNSTTARVWRSGADQSAS